MTVLIHNVFDANLSIEQFPVDCIGQNVLHQLCPSLYHICRPNDAPRTTEFLATLPLMVYLIPLDLDLSKAPRGATVIGAKARRVIVREHREDVCKLACHLKAPVHGVHGKPNDDFPCAEQHSPYDGIFEAIVPMPSHVL